MTQQPNSRQDILYNSESHRFKKENPWHFWSDKTAGLNLLVKDVLFCPLSEANDVNHHLPHNSHPKRFCDTSVQRAWYFNICSPFQSSQSTKLALTGMFSFIPVPSSLGGLLLLPWWSLIDLLVLQQRLQLCQGLHLPQDTPPSQWQGSPFNKTWKFDEIPLKHIIYIYMLYQIYWKDIETNSLVKVAEMLQARPVPGPVQAVAPGSTPGWPVWARRPQRRQRPQLPRPAEEAAAAQLAVEEGRGLRAWPPWPCIVLRLVTENCPTRLCNAMIYHNTYYYVVQLYGKL